MSSCRTNAEIRQPEAPAAQLSGGRVDSGWTLIELMIAMTILTIGLVSFLMALTSSLRLEAANHEVDVAANAARQMIERLRDEDFSLLLSSYNEATDDDPGGAGTAPGPHFTVPDLNPLPSDADGEVGQVIFPVTGGELREDASVPELGLPRDLNLDMIIDTADHSDDYLVLPVTVRLTWQGVNGEWSFEINTLLVYR